MNNTISFVNNGMIDIRAIKTFGVNSKDGDSAIGFFGTGLKYAIAIYLRLGCSIEISIGEETYIFSSVTERIRNDDFDLIVMEGNGNREHLAFTTELGKTWESWMAYREIHSNMLDEGGAVVNQRVEAIDEKTIVRLIGEVAVNDYLDRDKIFLRGDAHFTDDTIDVIKKPSQFIYYRGVKAGILPKESGFTFNIKQRSGLTEDRMISMDDAVKAIRKYVTESDDKEFIHSFVTSDYGFDASVDLNFYQMPSSVFVDIIKTVGYKKVKNPSLRSVYERHTKASFVPAIIEKNQIEQQQTDRALAVLKEIGFDVEVDVNMTDDLPNKTLGLCYDGKIFISKRVFMMGSKYLMATIMEENIHLEKNYLDETYEMQNYLFDIITTLAERVINEPI